MIHQRGIQHPQFQLVQQVFAVTDFHAQGMTGDFFSNFAGPTEHQRIAQTDFAADVQHIVITLGQRQVPSRGFPGFHQLVGVDHEGFTVRRQACAGAIAHEQGTAQMAFKLLHAGGDCGLSDMQFFCCRRQAAVADDFQKGAGEVDVHGLAGVERADIVRAPPNLWRAGKNDESRHEGRDSLEARRAPDSRERRT
ncbi:hypothetical protein D3C81_1458490 [compost metagenome]